MTKTTPLALAALLVFVSAARAQVARKPVPSDDRITDATTDFDDAKYPAGPVASMTFWGFNGAKTDESADQDRLCDMDVSELQRNAASALKRAPARAALAVEKTIVVSKGEWCDGREQPKGAGYSAPPECREFTVKHCAARLTIDGPARLQYKVIKREGTDKACRDALVKEMTANAVIDSAILPTYEGATNKTGCAAKILEIVAPR